MTKEDTRKAAEVMLAYADGKDIEVYDWNKQEWIDANSTINGWGWNWNARKFRIKPVKTRVPYEKVEELINDAIKNNWTVKFDGTKLL